MLDHFDNHKAIECDEDITALNLSVFDVFTKQIVLLNTFEVTN